jgi:hypothetical protein
LEEESLLEESSLEEAQAPDVAEKLLANDSSIFLRFTTERHADCRDAAALLFGRGIMGKMKSGLVKREPGGRSA